MKYENTVYLYDKQGFIIDIVYIADRARAMRYARNHSRYGRATIIINTFTSEKITKYKDGKKVGDSE